VDNIIKPPDPVIQMPEITGDIDNGGKDGNAPDSNPVGGGPI
jgi:hypothetical protein